MPSVQAQQWNVSWPRYIMLGSNSIVIVDMEMMVGKGTFEMVKKS